KSQLAHETVPSLRWHWGDIAAPSFIRGNTDLTFGVSYTDIPRSPEHLYAAFMFGVRRNFVQPNWESYPMWKPAVALDIQTLRDRTACYMVICASTGPHV